MYLMYKQSIKRLGHTTSLQTRACPEHLSKEGVREVSLAASETLEYMRLIKFGAKRFAISALLLLLLWALPNTAQAQIETTRDTVEVIDTTSPKKISYKGRHSPKKAAIFSAVLPGLGQAYNHKYWKIPIVYVGLGGLGFGVGLNHRNWRTYSDAFRIVANDTAINSYPLDGRTYSESQLRELKNYYKRNRDMFLIFTGVLYVLNIIDATVDAHLFDFDVSDDLSIHIEPMWQPNIGGQNGFTGMRIQLRL